MVEERIAIMRNVGFGLRDTNEPCLYFDTCTSEVSAALQVTTIGRKSEKSSKMLT